MCDYSLHNVRSRPAKVGDKLVTRQLSYTTRGFSDPADMNVAVCVLPGTELSFSDNVHRERPWPWSKSVVHHKTAVFRQVGLDNPHTHHDALEFPDGEIVLLTYLMVGQDATVLQLPASAGVAEQRTEPSIASEASPSLELIATLSDEETLAPKTSSSF
jgi:hypothetical protein